MIRISHIFSCDAAGCGEHEECGYAYGPGVVMETPYPPAGWTQIGHALYCSRHTLTLEIDQTAHTGQQINLKGLPS